MSNVAKVKIVAVPRREARHYLAKAEDFLAGAKDALSNNQYDTAMLAAVHSGISSVDAVCVQFGGKRSTDPNHARASDLLVELVGSGASTSAAQFRMLLAKKTAVEYEARRSNARDVEEAVKRANRLVTWANRMLSST